MGVLAPVLARILAFGSQIGAHIAVQFSTIEPEE